MHRVRVGWGMLMEEEKKGKCIELGLAKRHTGGERRKSDKGRTVGSNRSVEGHTVSRGEFYTDARPTALDSPASGGQMDNPVSHKIG